MSAALHKLRSNPLLSLEAQRWRKRLPWALPVALAAMALTCTITAAPSLIGTGDATGADEFMSLLTVLGWAGNCGVGLVWLVVLVVIPILAGTAINQLRDSGLGDSLRITLLTGYDIADGYFTRALMRHRLWLLGAALLPLGSATGLTTGLVFQTQYAGAPGADPAKWIATLAYPLVYTVLALVQLAACVEIGVLAGLYARSPGNTAALTLAGLFVFELMLPSGCGICQSIGQILLIEGTTGESGAAGSTMLYAMLAGLGVMGVQMLYQAGLFLAARAFAARRFDQAEV